MDALYQFDVSVFRAVHLGFRSPFFDLCFFIITSSGLAEWQLLGILLSPLLYRPNQTFSTYWSSLFQKSSLVGPFLFTVAFSGLVISGLTKRFIKRDRPSNLDWAIPTEDWRMSSFPSGHTTTAFAVAILVAIVWWHRDRRIAIVALVWATLVGISRIYVGVHWPTDAVGGACAGAIGAGLTYLLFKTRILAFARKQSE